MHRRTIAIETNLYDLISSLHDQTTISDSQIPETVHVLAASRKIKWMRNNPLMIETSKVKKPRAKLPRK